jgi:hypothetical protein
MAAPAIDPVHLIASAVTPAVMVSACALFALGLDNQAGRISQRARDLMREHRQLPAESPRREELAQQVLLLDRRHHLLSRCLLLDYGALLAFVATSLLSLAQVRLHLPFFLPIEAFFVGVALLCASAVYALLAIKLARAALRIEIEEARRSATK